MGGGLFELIKIASSGIEYYDSLDTVSVFSIRIGETILCC